MAASTEAIKVQFKGQDGAQPEYSATAYYACLQDMLNCWIKARLAGQSIPIGSIETLSYCYSAIISMLDFGVIQNQEDKIVETAMFLLKGATFVKSQSAGSVQQS